MSKMIHTALLFLENQPDPAVAEFVGLERPLSVIGLHSSDAQHLVLDCRSREVELHTYKHYRLLQCLKSGLRFV